jgi:hypothetical protein
VAAGVLMLEQHHWRVGKSWIWMDNSAENVARGKNIFSAHKNLFGGSVKM